ncbi:restriction endonuclease subunit S [Yersinia massiliensis]|nr:restriction endonuclease subunit S [Yersinia enterocolitica]EKN6040140.1 restriction endonuclease subunit S [Yersinia enterocolitica]QKJ13484.1 restriction endonuclease subunit S [Yersinia massiliensis]
MGPFGSDIKVEFFVDHGVPVLNGQNISDFKLKDCFKNYVTEERAAGYKKAIAKRGDIIITHRGTLGQIAYIPDDSEFEEYVISQSQFRVKLKSELVNPIYFTYYFHTDEGQKRLLSFKSHVGVPALAQATTNFRLLDFPIRSKTEQDAVANFLVKIDKKIDLNSRINTELEAMAKTLYDYWFVQFDFPDANGKPYKTSGGKMVYNLPLKRNIPVDWEVRTLSQIANITMGQSPVGESYNDDGNGSLFFQGSTDFGWLFPTPRQYTTSPARMAKKGDILLSVRAPVGDMNIANADCCIGRGLAALNSKSGSDGFLFYVMKYFKQVFDRRNSEGTTFGSITKDDLHSLEVIYPQNNILKKYDDIVSEFNKMIFLRSLENRDLIKLRDWLLPMLMNGQVTVR